MSRRVAVIAVAVCLLWTAAGAALLWPERGDRDTATEAAPSSASESVAAGDPEPAADPEPSPEPTETADEGTSAEGANRAPFALAAPEPPYPVTPHLKHPPAAAILFDVETGEVLWARRAERRLPIASLTKMMTALVIAERHRPSERVIVSRKAIGVEGSRIGVLRAGRRVPLGGLFAGLLLASGNDAAAALAEHDARTIAAFVARMNRRADDLGLTCTRFAGPAGLQDNGNSSCARDLAALARADLANAWIASTMRRRSIRLPFPVKGGVLSLANNHFFVQRGLGGIPAARVTGVKTGYTNGAGRCYVTTARLRGAHLGVVLLDSPDPLRQVPALLGAGFAASGVLEARARPPRAPNGA
jgi:D-alanyl-D-alanine carboxypeptidase